VIFDQVEVGSQNSILKRWSTKARRVLLEEGDASFA
jgi:hypothetical protein